MSFETPDLLTIFGFLRLRLSPSPGSGAFESLKGCALIRELHVYGQLVLATTAPKPNRQVGDLTTDAQQHKGFGRQLMFEAERIASKEGFEAIAVRINKAGNISRLYPQVISGVGTREYYRKLGYTLNPDGNYLIKRLPKRRIAWIPLLLSFIGALIIFAAITDDLGIRLLYIISPASFRSYYSFPHTLGLGRR